MFDRHRCLCAHHLTALRPMKVDPCSRRDDGEPPIAVRSEQGRNLLTHLQGWTASRRQVFPLDPLWGRAEGNGESRRTFTSFLRPAPRCGGVRRIGCRRLRPTAPNRRREALHSLGYAARLSLMIAKIAAKSPLATVSLMSAKIAASRPLATVSLMIAEIAASRPLARSNSTRRHAIRPTKAGQAIRPLATDHTAQHAVLSIATDHDAILSTATDHPARSNSTRRHATQPTKVGLAILSFATDHTAKHAVASESTDHDAIRRYVATDHPPARSNTTSRHATRPTV